MGCPRFLRLVFHRCADGQRRMPFTLDCVLRVVENSPMHHPISRVVDLLDPSLNRISNMDVEAARRRVLSADPVAIRGIDGSFALVASEGTAVRLARSMDRPTRYFLAKRQDGPALY